MRDITQEGLLGRLLDGEGRRAKGFHCWCGGGREWQRLEDLSGHVPGQSPEDVEKTSSPKLIGLQSSDVNRYARAKWWVGQGQFDACIRAHPISQTLPRGLKKRRYIYRYMPTVNPGQPSQCRCVLFGRIKNCTPKVLLPQVHGPDLSWNVTDSENPLYWLFPELDSFFSGVSSTSMDLSTRANGLRTNGHPDRAMPST